MGRASLSANATSITATVEKPKKYMKLIFKMMASTEATAPKIRFNGDSGGNYSNRRSDNGGADGTASSTNGIATILGGWFNTIGVEASVMGGDGVNGRIKTIDYRSVANAAPASGLPTRGDGSGTWHNNSAPITSISVVTDTANSFSAGTELIILGHD